MGRLPTFWANGRNEGDWEENDKRVVLTESIEKRRRTLQATPPFVISEYFQIREPFHCVRKNTSHAQRPTLDCFASPTFARYRN
jgi:hypothetical protein